MPPNKTNSKKESGRAKKAENEAKKADAKSQEKERQEAAKWAEDAKGKSAKDLKEEKRREELAKKAERERLLAEEESSLPAKPKAAPKAGAKKKVAPKPAGPGAIAAGGGIAGDTGKKASSADGLDDGGGKSRDFPEEVESFSATGVDAALELLEVVNAKKDKASVGTQAANLEKHPERRFKATFEAYQERELPNLRKEHPGLRLQQYKELIYKQFQKSPENPFNQTTVAFDASKEERVEALERRNREVEDRLRERPKGS